jgi:hypothetical protein
MGLLADGVFAQIEIGFLTLHSNGDFGGLITIKGEANDDVPEEQIQTF